VTRLFTTTALAVLLAARPLAAGVPPCQTPKDVAAMQFRQLQAELMVAALKCGGGATAFDFNGAYAIFVRMARPDLIHNAGQLRAMFARAGMGAGAIDDYQTELSNNAEIESQTAKDYCGGAALAMAYIVQLPRSELGAYAARTIPVPFGANACSAPVREAADGRNPS